MKKVHSIFLALSLTLLIALNVYFFSEFLSEGKKEIKIARVIDGDTFVSNEGVTYRLANINTPEKNEAGYEEAKDYLLSLENDTIEIDEIGPDKYNRVLIRAYTPEYINLEIIKYGLGKKFLVDNKELKDFDKAEEEAVQNSLGLWTKSSSYGCFQVDIDQKYEVLKIKNKCKKTGLYNWHISDESRKKYKFENVYLEKNEEVLLHTSSGKQNKSDIFWDISTTAWNNDRDTVYLFDEEDRIVHHQSYGY